MSWTERYKKQGCAAAKDVNFTNIDSISKVKVPAMVISSFQKKVAAAKAPFDVYVEVDSAAGKGRIVVKKLPPSDVTLEWADRSGGGAEAAKGVIKVKAELTSLGITNNAYLKEILEVKEKVKGLKEEVKGVEETADYYAVSDVPAGKKVIGEKRDALTKASTKGKEIYGKHQDWYLNGPRKGIAPILKKFSIEEKDLNATDADTFAKALHAMSGAANQVKAVWDVDIRTATEALIVRLNNLESSISKGHSLALADIRKNLGVEVQKLVELVGKAETELKLEKTNNLMTQLKDPNSAAYKRLVLNPSNIKVEMESNKTRVAVIPKYIEMVTKSVSRLKKGIPAEFVKDPEIGKMFTQMDLLSNKNTKTLTEGKSLLEKCDMALANFGK